MKIFHFSLRIADDWFTLTLIVLGMESNEPAQRGGQFDDADMEQWHWSCVTFTFIQGYCSIGYRQVAENMEKRCRTTVLPMIILDRS